MKFDASRHVLNLVVPASAAGGEERQIVEKDIATTLDSGAMQ